MSIVMSMRDIQCVSSEYNTDVVVPNMHFVIQKEHEGFISSITLH